MSYRLRRKTRPQGDVEIYGGPLKQKRFDGGMNIDVPASEIKDNEVAYASNVIFREFGFEARPGTIQISESGFSDISGANLYGYVSNSTKFGIYATNYNHIVSYNSTIRFYNENPIAGTMINAFGYNWNTNVDFAAWNPGTGDTTMVPYRRGVIVFSSSKISYCEGSGAFQVNAANPVHGVKDDNASGAFKYRYLITLSRSSVYGSDGLISTYTATDRNATGAELVHESGSNGYRYNNSGTSTARQTDYGEVFRATAISGSSAYSITNADLKAAFSSTSSVTDNSAAGHFTHATLWRTRDFGDAGSALGNSKVLYYWVADVKRSDIFGGSGYSDTMTDDAIQNNGLILKTQGFDPLPSGSCGEVAGGWLFVSDRTNSTSETYLNYCAVSNSPENIGYYFADVQKQRFSQGIRAMRANQDILSIFCESSSHICNMTSYVSDLSKIQSVPFLNYFHAVDRAIGIKDWASLDSVDENTMIAICSDGSVRKWDTTRWGDDMAYEKVSTEIQQIVPASPFTYERGSVGKYYNGAYYIWYSTNSSDTATTKCLRYGFGKKAGYGWSYYTGFPQPNFKRGVAVVDETQGVQRLVVIRATDGRFYWCETFNAFTGALDHAGASGSGDYPMVRTELDFNSYPNQNGTEISSTIRFRELIGNSESDTLVHDETFNRWRPRVQADGYRSGMTVSMSAYKDGSTTAYETVTKQPRTASVKFTKEIAARRVQLEVATNVGAWRYVGIDSYFRSLDKINYATAGDNSSSESTTSYPQYQADLADEMDLWLTRRDQGLDRATGTQMTPAYTGKPVLADGPDSKTDSAYYFSATPTARDYTEDWSGTDSYWDYDGDQDFSTYTGYFATSASGSAAVFLGGTFFTMPMTSAATYPLKMRHRLRCLSNNSTNTAFCIFDVAEDSGFSGDFLSFVVGFDNASGKYFVEVIGSKNGVPFDDYHVTTITRVADIEFLIDIEVSSVGWRLTMPNYGYTLSDTSGFSFGGIEYIDVNVQRTDASNQGMVKESRLYTEEIGTSDARYDETASNTYAGDFSASFWFKGYSYDRDILRISGARPMYFQLTDSTHLDVCGLGIATLTAVGSGWNHIFVRRVGTSITVYQNGTLVATITDSGPTSLGGGNKHVGPSNGSGYLADVRVYSDDKSVDANTYYYNNVLNEQGDMVMPQV